MSSCSFSSSALNSSCESLQSRLLQLRASREREKTAKGKEKHWDNVSAEVIEKLNDLEDHREFVAHQQEAVLSHSKNDMLLFKHKHQLLKRTSEMSHSIERIIHTEKDKLIEVFDNQLN